MSGIFISYRHEDSAGHAGRLADDLSNHFGPEKLFRDIDTLEPGIDFIEAIEKAVGSCDVLLAVIGRQWLTSVNAQGQRRLDEPGDFVLLEISAALSRDIRIIPVLVQGATMPRSQDLPGALEKLARRQAYDLSDARWKYDVERLIETLEKVLEPDGLNKTYREQLATGRKKIYQALSIGTLPRLKMLSVFVGAGVILLTAFYLLKGTSDNPTLSKNQSPPSVTKVLPSPEGRNDSVTTAAVIDEGTTVRGSTVTGQDRYFFKFIASSTKTRVILRKRSTRGFRAAVDVYDHVENRVAGKAEGGTLLLAQDSQEEPVSLSFESNTGEIYYIKVRPFVESNARGDYELTVQQE